MPIEIRPINVADITEMVTWRYDPPYGDYDLTMPLAEAIKLFMAPETRCHAILIGGDLGGYCTFGEDARVPGGDYSDPALDIGAAINPELTGAGRGSGYVAAIIDFAIEKFRPDTLRVSIARSNLRATRVWVSNGFVETQRFDTTKEILGTTEFATSVRQVAS